MELVLPYAFCKLHGIALVNNNKVSTLHYSGELNPKIISNIQVIPPKYLLRDPKQN